MNREILGQISRLASRDPFYLGWHLVRYVEGKEMSMEELGRELGCLPETINSISLCRAPHPEPPRFQDDIERVADRFQVRSEKLMGIVRYARISSEDSVILAARDRAEDDPSDE